MQFHYNVFFSPLIFISAEATPFFQWGINSFILKFSELMDSSRAQTEPQSYQTAMATGTEHILTTVPQSPRTRVKTCQRAAVVDPPSPPA